MTRSLIQAQHLADSFLRLFPTSEIKVKGIEYKCNASGSIQPTSVPMDVQLKLADILSPTRGPQSKYKRLFDGDLSIHNHDHSAADLALIGYFAKQGLTEPEADQVFRSSKLYRPKWDEMHGVRTYGEMTIRKGFSGRVAAAASNQTNHTPRSALLLSHDSYRPTYHPHGMPPREFVGPSICLGTKLFPMTALSSLVALGGVGKTSVLISIGIHIAAGKNWNNYQLEQKKVAMFFCEETQEEIDRKFSAIVDNWNVKEREEALKNFAAISFLGQDARLTLIDGKQYTGTGMTEQIIEFLKEFELKDGLVIFDHMQGFTSGDLNSSETSTSICLETNKIVSATGAAVVLAAHISKNNIKAETVEQGFAVGSLAFENATRQMSGITPMSQDQAKKYGLEGLHRNYALLGVAKNSYGAITEGLWFQKVFSPKFHTVVFEPVNLQVPIPAAKLSAYQRLCSQLKDYLAKHPFTTKNRLDALSGKEEIFKESKSKIRDALTSLIELGEIFLHSITEEERIEHSLSKQVKEVLRVK
jgi:hypothetical protein